MKEPAFDLAQIVAKFSAAVLDESAWEAAIAGLCAPLGANGACLFSPTAPPGTGLAVTTGSNTAALSTYLADWVAHDAWTAAAQQLDSFQHAGDVQFGRTVLPQTVLRRTAFYVDFLRPFEVEDILSVKLTDGRDPQLPVYHLSVYRPLTKQTFSLEHQEHLRALWPHVRRLLLARETLQSAQALERAAEEMLELLPSPAFVVRSDGLLEHANRAGAKCLTRADVVVRHGRVTAIGQLGPSDIAQALADAPTGGGRSWVALLPRALPIAASVHVVPIAESPPYRLRWPNAHALIILALPMPAEHRAQWYAALARRYRLTATECRVMERLAAGEDPVQIAVALNVGLATVRTHLQNLYGKTGCNRQAELVILAGGAGAPNA